jgi:hypothetical protein
MSEGESKQLPDTPPVFPEVKAFMVAFQKATPLM